MLSFVMTYSRWLLPVLTVVLLVKCLMTLLLGRPVEKTYAYLIDLNDGEQYPLNMWETAIGRSATNDIIIGYPTVSRSQAVISRRIDGWYVYDLRSKSGILVNGKPCGEKAMIRGGDRLTFGNMHFRFSVIDDPVIRVGKQKRQPVVIGPAPVRLQPRPVQKPGPRPVPRPAPPVNPTPVPAPVPRPVTYQQSAGAQTRPAQRPLFTPDPSTGPGRPGEPKRRPDRDPPQGPKRRPDRDPPQGPKRRPDRDPPQGPQRSPDRDRQRPQDGGRDVFSGVNRDFVGVQHIQTAARGNARSMHAPRPTIVNPKTGAKYALAGNTVTIGRSHSCDILLDEPTVSRRHATLMLYEDGWAITDNGSVHGTFLNGNRVTGPQVLYDGDVLTLADAKLKFVRA